MNIIVAGSRNVEDYELVVEKLNKLTGRLDEITIISGAARGADQLGERWAKENGHEVVQMKAEWHKYGKGAGYKRIEAR